MKDINKTFNLTKSYRGYVLAALLTVYLFNFIDRQLMVVLLEPIKKEFALSDSLMGLLTGLAFALFYTFLGLPLGRLADKMSRVNLIAICFFIWSLFSAATGFAQSFLQLLLFRIGVGIGEAGCNPAAYSLIGDYYPKEKRTTALSIYSLGIPIGMFLALILGGYIAKNYGWRMAFFLSGTIGMVLALGVKLTVRRIPRGYSDQSNVAQKTLPIKDLIKKVWGLRSFRYTVIGAALAAFSLYGFGAFVVAFFMRSHGMNIAKAGISLGLVYGMGAIPGFYFAGKISDVLYMRTGDMRYLAWVPAASLIIAIPTGIAAFLIPDTKIVLVLLVLINFFSSMFFTPILALTQSLVLPNERGFTGAILLFIVNLIGLGFGPLATGWFSDLYKSALINSGVASVDAAAHGLQYALCTIFILLIFPIAAFIRGAKYISEDASKPSA